MSVEQRLTEIEARTDALETEAEQAIAQALYDSLAGGSSGLDDMLAAVCLTNADVAVGAIVEADIGLVSRADVEWLTAQVRGLYAIVKDLAELDPIEFDARGNPWYCPLCGAESASLEVAHDASCPWRRAVEAMEAQ